MDIPEASEAAPRRAASVSARAVNTLQLPPLQSVKLLDQVRERIRYLHYSPRTEDAYVYWIRSFIRFHRLQHPRDLGGTVLAVPMWRCS